VSGPRGEGPVIHLGTSGWSYPGWKGPFYPPDLPSRQWLEFYASRFATVEINMTFYRLPKTGMLIGWRDRTPPGFLFTLKANRRITHLKRLRDVEGDVRDFYALGDALGEKLGAVLFQLPPSMTRDLGLLARFLETLSSRHRNVIEFRDASWYAEETYDLMRKHRTAFCTVPSGRVPDTTVETADIAYFRFHGPTGRYDSSYPDADLAAWAAVIGRVRAAECFVYFNNDYRGFAVENGLRLGEMLGVRRPGSPGSGS